MAIRRAAEKYGVPCSTLHDHVSGRVQFGAKSGLRRYLNSSKELELVNFLSGMSSLGYSRTVKQVIEIVQSVVIFDKKSLKPEMSIGEVPGTMYRLSGNGWIDSEIFESWFTSHFLAYAFPT